MVEEDWNFAKEGLESTVVLNGDLSRFGINVKESWLPHNTSFKVWTCPKSPI
jgi:hypothetical protein